MLPKGERGQREVVALLKKKKMVQSLMRDAAALDVPAVQCALQQQFDKVQRSLRTRALNKRLTIDMRRHMKKEREDRAAPKGGQN